VPHTFAYTSIISISLTPFHSTLELLYSYCYCLCIAEVCSLINVHLKLLFNTIVWYGSRRLVTMMHSNFFLLCVQLTRDCLAQNMKHPFEKWIYLVRTLIKRILLAIITLAFFIRFIPIMLIPLRYRLISVNKSLNEVYRVWWYKQSVQQ